jgi:hypothetical protein
MLSFSTYTPAFLFELSDELELELPNELRAKIRVGREEVRGIIIRLICLWTLLSESPGANKIMFYIVFKFILFSYRAILLYTINIGII